MSVRHYPYVLGATVLAMASLLPDCRKNDGVDGGPQTVCRDPSLRQHYRACLRATDEASCRAAKGRWSNENLERAWRCECRTGQGDCACTSASDCLGACVAPLGQDNTCEGVTQGKCTETAAAVGCQCHFDASGKPRPICVD